MDEEEKTSDVSRKGDKKRTAIIAAIATAIVLAGIGGGYAYASGREYSSYKIQLDAAKKADAKLVRKLAEAEKLVEATKDTDVLDKTALDSLAKNLKTGESRKGVPDVGTVGRWNLWGTSKAKSRLVDDAAEANGSVNAISKAMSKMEASKTAKQIKDTKDALDKTVKSAEALYKDSEGKVQDDKTRGSLKTAIDNAKKTSSNKKADVKSLTTVNDALVKAVKAVNDSKNAKAQADVQKQSQEQAQSQAQSAGTSSGGYSSSNSSNAGGYSTGSNLHSGNTSQTTPSYSNTGSTSGSTSSNGTSSGGTWDWRNDKDDMGGGFRPITKDNINEDGSATVWMDSHGNMW